LHIGSTVLRLGPETSVTFLNLGDRITQLRLAQGSLMLRVRHLDDEDNFEIDTPNLVFNVLRTGEYRVNVDSDGDRTAIDLWRGRGEVTGGGYNYTLVAGQEAHFSGANPLNYDIEQLPGDDDFDRWAFERDRREDAFQTPNYISPEMTGYEDLDDYGRWTYVAGYGNCWVPGGVPEGWAPYRTGHWAWIPPWGWTWVDDEPWGFAPFHYGRWAYGPAGWFWVPGPPVVRPVYAPALVVFLGNGLVTAGGPAVGWFPLAPGEVYVPPYRVSPTYVQNVNVTNTTVNVTKVTNIYNTVINNNNGNGTQINYINRRVPNGITAVPRETFVNARPVPSNVVPLSEKQVAGVPVSRIAPVQPNRGSLAAAAPAKAKPPGVVESRRVVAKVQPAPPRPPLAERPGAPVKGPESVRPQPYPQPGSNQPRNPEANRPAEPVRPPDNREVPRPPSDSRGQSMPTESYRSQPNRGSASTPDNREVPRPEEQGPTPRNGESPENSHPPQPWTHPLAKPVPSPAPKSEQQMQQEEQQYHAWVQQRQSNAPQRDVPRPPSR
jgi:hypothetical protein